MRDSYVKGYSGNEVTPFVKDMPSCFIIMQKAYQIKSNENRKGIKCLRRINGVGNIKLGIAIYYSVYYYSYMYPHLIRERVYENYSDDIR